MDHFKNSQPVKRYYEILGVSTDAPAGAIRTAYKRLAMKYHPDKCNFKDRAEAKRSFQDIQEAYAVLSDQKKKALYDCGLYSPKDDDADVEGLSSFLDEMTSMMGRVQTSQDMGAGSCLEDLQSLFLSMFSSDLAALNKPCPPSAMNFDKKRSWKNSDFDSSYVESCFMGQTFSSPLQTQYFVNEKFYVESNSNGASKKIKCAAGGMSSSACDMGARNEGSKITAGFYASRGTSLFNMKMHDTQYDGSTA